MKVISQVNIEDWSYECICDHCDSKLQVESNDLIYKFYDGDFREPGYSVYQVTCAVCNNMLDISGNKIPKLIQIEAEKKI
jgi:hypothetical protein